MALPPELDQRTGTGPEPYSSLEAVDGVPRAVVGHSELIPLELKPDSTYPEAVYEVDREAPEAVNLGEEDAPQTKKAVISKRWVWLIVVILVSTVAAIGGGVGGTLAAKNKKSASQPLTTTQTSSSALPPSATSTPRAQFQTGTSISSVTWGAGPSFQMKVYFQGNDSYIYESSFAAGKWTASSPKRLIQAKSLTPIASMFYPSDGTGNVSVTTYLYHH